MHRAQMRDAARAQKFYFRKHLEGIPLSKDKTTVCSNTNYYTLLMIILLLIRVMRNKKLKKNMKR